MNPFVLLEWQLDNPQFPVIVHGGYATYEAAVAAMSAEPESSRFTVSQVLGPVTSPWTVPLTPQSVTNVAPASVVVVKINWTGISNIPAIVYGVFAPAGAQTAWQVALAWIAGQPYGGNCVVCMVQP